MADDPFRLRVQKRLCEIIESVTPANGYVHDLTPFVDPEDDETKKRVYRGRPDFGFSDPRPMISILENPENLDQLISPQGNPERLGVYELFVTGFVEDDNANPTDPAHRLAAEVIVAISKELKRDGGYNVFGMGHTMPNITNTRNLTKIGSPTCLPGGNDISDVAMFFFRLDLDLVENIEDPFA